jgi:hypothetical protein
MEVEMKIRGLMMDPVTNMPIVVLKDVTSDVVLPIWVGVYEANAIALEIEKVTTPRPMTHDLIKNLLIGLDTHVHKVVVNELRDDTFFAVIWMEREGKVISIDSRPSDALALALRLDCPIFVEECNFHPDHPISVCPILPNNSSSFIYPTLTSRLLNDFPKPLAYSGTAVWLSLYPVLTDCRF